jgi:DNA-binding winged helix-turn-helix (wHTH) protein
MPDQPRLARFGPFEADLVTGELRNNGRPVALQQQPFRLLQALLEQPGELVTRETLRRRLWAEGTFVAFERGLTSAMRKVRDALGDRADAPLYIETLAGRGYRFIAPVTFGVGPGSDRGQSSDAGRLNVRSFSHHVAAWPRRFGWIAALVVLGLTIAGHGPSPIVAHERLEAALSLSSYACRLKSERRYDEALAVIRQAHALAPESARITAEVGFYLHAAGQYEAEFPMLRRALAQDARSAEAWLHLGLAYARRSDFVEAIPALERAHALAPHDATVERWLAWARAQTRSHA